MKITITGAAELARELSVNLNQANLLPALTAVAAAIQNVLAPYPPAPAKKNPWYERGYGTKYLRKDGKVTGRKTSQLLNRSWYIEPEGQRAILLGNRATYSPWVHSHDKQNKVHARTGWVTDRQAIDAVTTDGTVTRIFAAFIHEILPTE